jgi:hypothetical protein
MAEQAEEERRKEEKRRERLLLPIDGVADTLKKRHMVINEIINTEKDYVYDLQVLLTVFMYVSWRQLPTSTVLPYPPLLSLCPGQDTAA